MSIVIFDSVFFPNESFDFAKTIVFLVQTLAFFNDPIDEVSYDYEHLISTRSRSFYSGVKYLFYFYSCSYLHIFSASISFSSSHSFFWWLDV
ncbi:hypothetical protein R3W88_000778 [Solanum pinnatisectum]|uniref:Uncharacterized protein n=1 Tax=Solanum pinnatisectum TaxID=50273 RepID=A0AAV9MGA4_9SOLN|nr:hypothetical protein R3W88_000778 [Solanum pinnatisectum]